MRSLAVLPTEKGRGIGRRIVEALEAEARDADLVSLFAFTYVPGFFSQLGFELVDRALLPLKAWKDCLRCPKFQNCDEIAVLKKLKDAPDYSMPAPAQGVFPLLPSGRPVAQLREIAPRRERFGKAPYTGCTIRRGASGAKSGKLSTLFNII